MILGYYATIKRTEVGYQGHLQDIQHKQIYAKSYDEIVKSLESELSDVLLWCYENNFVFPVKTDIDDIESEDNDNISYIAVDLDINSENIKKDFFNQQTDTLSINEKIALDEVLSEEPLEFKTGSDMTQHLVIQKRTSDSEGRIYYVFRYLGGKSIMNWTPKDYKLAGEQIYIGDIPIVLELPSEPGTYFPISNSNRHEAPNT